MFHLQPKAMTEDEVYAVDSLYHEWERRVLWPRNTAEQKKHDALCAGKPRIYRGPSDLTGWCRCRDRQDEVHEWEDWFMRNYPKDTLERVWG